MPIISVEIIKIIDKRETKKNKNKNKKNKQRRERARGTKAIVIG